MWFSDEHGGAALMVGLGFFPELNGSVNGPD